MCVCCYNPPHCMHVTVCLSIEQDMITFVESFSCAYVLTLLDWIDLFCSFPKLGLKDIDLYIPIYKYVYMI